MNKKLFNPLLIFSLINLTILPSGLSAQTAQSQQNTGERLPIKFKQPKPPPDAPKVGRGQGGASRGKCSFADSSSSKIALTPLIPTNGWGSNKTRQNWTGFLLVRVVTYSLRGTNRPLLIFLY